MTDRKKKKNGEETGEVLLVHSAALLLRLLRLLRLRLPLLLLRPPLRPRLPAAGCRLPAAAAAAVSGTVLLLSCVYMKGEAARCAW